MKIYYKIVALKNNEYYYLFHGINNNKKIPLNTWIKAEIKENVSDGVGKSYTSGIHVIDGYENALNYVKRFKRNDRVIIKCYAKNLSHKEKSKEYVYLAEQIYINENNRIQN